MEEPEGKQLLQATYKLVEENNRMLHKVRGVQKRQAFFSMLKWLIIIGIAVGAFYFLQPYVDNIMKFIKETGATFDTVKNILPK